MNMKAQCLQLFVAFGIFSGFVPAIFPHTVNGSVTVNGTVSPAAPAFSGRINDVVTLTQSGVDESIVMSYIKNSPGPFQPDAQEIIKLRDSGVSPDVITAILQRGAELRDQGVNTTQ